MSSREFHNNANAWESEYRDPSFLTLGTEPINAFKEFVKWIRKQVRKNPADFSAPVSEWTVLDLGCGNGKNVKYIVENYAKSGIGYDVSETAIATARGLAENLNLEYEVRSIAKLFPIRDASIDLALDVTSSNSLTNDERAYFLGEVSRALKSGAYFFTRALCKDGDTNVKNLIAQFPGSEPDTYILGETGITERVFTKKDFEEIYSPHFDIVHLEKLWGYQKWGDRTYKRNYWIAYLKVNKN